MSRDLDGGGETNTLVTIVEDGVVLAHEDISKNPKRSTRSGDVDSGHTEEADRDTFLSDLVDVVLSFEGEVDTVEGDDDGGEAGDSVTVDGVLVGVHGDGGSSDGLGDGLHISGGTGEDRGTRVGDGVRSAGDAVSTESERIELELPVRLGDQRNVSDRTSELGSIDSSEGELSVDTGGAGEREGEDGVRDDTLLNTGDEGGSDGINGDGRPAETADSIELTDLEGETGLLSGFSEELVGDDKVTHLDGILRDETRERTRTVTDLKVSSIGDVGGRLRRLVLLVEAERALGRRNPEVGGTGVVDDVEGLRGGSDGHGSKVLGVHVVVDRDGGAVSETVLGAEERGEGLGFLLVRGVLAGKGDAAELLLAGVDRERKLDTEDGSTRSVVGGELNGVVTSGGESGDGEGLLDLDISGVDGALEVAEVSLGVRDGVSRHRQLETSGSRGGGGRGRSGKGDGELLSEGRRVRTDIDGREGQNRAAVTVLEGHIVSGDEGREREGEHKGKGDLHGENTFLIFSGKKDKKGGDEEGTVTKRGSLISFNMWELLSRREQ